MPTPNDYSRLSMGGDNTSDYKRRTSEGMTGNFESARPEAGLLPEYGDDLVPTPGDPERQFSSDKASTPKAVASETDDSQNAFAELQQFLNNNCETPGSRIAHPQSKPWTPPHGAEGE